jgi:hypothetical protein
MFKEYSTKRTNYLKHLPNTKIKELFSIDFHLFCQKERNKQKVESLFIKSIKTTRLEIIDKTVYIAEQILLFCRI